MSKRHDHPNISYTENIIIWEKWVDPYASDSDLEDFLEDSNNNEYADQDEETENKNLQPSQKITKFKAIATPMGIIPIDETTDSSKIFNFWIGHTNFDITYGVAAIIDGFAGVETLDIFTRYRFRIGIGKAFNDSEVMRNLNQTVYDYLI